MSSYYRRNEMKPNEMMPFLEMYGEMVETDAVKEAQRVFDRKIKKLAVLRDDPSLVSQSIWIDLVDFSQ
jgi:hypothetical protein